MASTTTGTGPRTEGGNTVSTQFGYEIGKNFPILHATAPGDYLDAVLRAERFIARHRLDTVDGIAWRNDDSDRTLVELYDGAAGVSYFYLRLFQALGDAEHGHIARESARYLAKHWRDAFWSTNMRFPVPDDPVPLQNGIYRGVGSPGQVLLEAWDEFHDDLFAAAAREIADYYRISARYDADGAYWENNTSIYFDGGIILYLIAVQRRFPNDAIGELIACAAHHYVAAGRDDGHGGLLYDGMRGLWDGSWPNWEFGSPGAAYVLARAYEAVGDERLLDAAKRALRHIDQVKITQGKGWLIPFVLHTDGTPERLDGEPIFYLGWCNGIVGVANAFYELYRLTGDDWHLRQIEAMVDGFESLGAPERQTSGLWNSVCYCCGHASILQFFVSLHAADGNPRWLSLARRTASVLLGVEERLDGDASDWPIAWERLKPTKLWRHIGYYDGAAGVASSLLQLYLLETGRFRWRRLIDDPFPERALRQD